LLVALERDERLIVPSGGLILQVGDRLSVLADPAAEANVRKLLEPQTLAGPTTTD
jgi:Trk K+ transport system NAD-binding subunit